ncbi:MAG: Ig-like domain-containing protein [Methanobrevibacter sp.]|jgi:hypothetical protein|nr:Ig-like domain-containing protein [Candidatus Methanovirga australis]
MMKYSRIVILIVLFFSIICFVSSRPVFDVEHTVNTTLFFNLTELGYTQDTIDLVNRSVMDCFEYWGRNGYALLGTGRNVTSISTGAKLGDSILFCESPSTNSNYTIYSATNNSNFGYRNETSFSNSWLNVIFPSMLVYFNASTMNSTDWTIYMTFHEGYVFDVSGNGTGTLIKTILNVSAPDINLGDTTNVTATLTMNDGTPVNNKTINLTIEGVEYLGVTDEMGVVVVPYNNTSRVGKYNVTANFEDDDHYYGSNASTTFNVNGGNDNNGTNDGSRLIADGLPLTAVPFIVVLVLTIVGGVYYRKR